MLASPLCRADGRDRCRPRRIAPVRLQGTGRLPPAGLIALVCVIQIAGMAPLAVFPALIPVFRDAWAISNTGAGWISGVFFTGMLGAVALGTALTDRLDAKRVFASGLAISGLAAFGFAATADGAWSAGVWRVLQGVGFGATYMPGLKLLTDLLPVGRASRATSFYTATYYLGAGLAYLIALKLQPALGWRATFAWVAAGPLAGLLLSLPLIPAPPRPQRRPATRLLDYRPVLTSRPALGFALIYGLHNLEVFAFSSWLVPLLVFSRSLQDPATPGADGGLGMITALVSVVGLPASIAGNELAQRIGRQRVIIGVMLGSATIGVALGALAGGPYALVVALAFAYSAAIAADSATATAGIVEVAPARFKGTTMSLYAIVGFTGAMVGPVVFGAALDLAGGGQAAGAWLAAFGAIALLMLAGPVAARQLIDLGPIGR
jgi:MFS family permease